MSFEDTWASAKVNDGNSNNDPPAEGDFQVRLMGASAFTSKGGNEVMTLELRVTEGEHADYEWTELRGFGSQGAANAAKTTADRIGVDVASVRSLAELDAALKRFVGWHYEVNVARSGEYLNTYFNAAFPPEGAEPAPAPTPATPDDIPF